MGSMHGRPDIDLAGFIETQPVGRRQIQLLLMCAAVLFTDGFDTQAIGYVAPDLAREWQLSRGALGSVFSAGLFGLLLGSLIFSPIADRVGRKWIVVGSTAAFGLLSLATTLAPDVTSLTVLRFLTGLGLGGAMPNAVALTAEISPHRRRATMVMAMFCGFSLGAAVGGLIAAAMVPALGWRSVFVLGGVVPLLLAVFLARALPESARFLALRGTENARVARIVTWLFPDQASSPGARFIVTERAVRGMPVRELFADGRSGFTLLLWTVFFMSLVDLYFLSNWLPTVLNDLGTSVSTAALIGSMLQIGGLVGTFALGSVIDRFSFRALAATYLLAAVAVACVGLMHRSVPGVTAAVFASGFCIVGGQIAANALAAGSYPTTARATGVGWALGIGRVGSIVGPLLGWHIVVVAVVHGKPLRASGGSGSRCRAGRPLSKPPDKRDPNMSAIRETDVVIAGGGPVGLGLAVELGQRGVRCLLVERYQKPQPIPRGQNLTNRTMEHFHFWGAEQALRAARTVPKEFGIGGMTSYGTLLGNYHYDWLQRELVKPFYFTDNERLPQYATEAVLRERLAQLSSVETAFGWSVSDLSQDSDGVGVQLSERTGSGRRTVKAAYAVGCDGSRSIVRDKAGITETRQDHDRLMVLLVFRSEQLHRLLERFPGKSFFNVLHPDLDGYWQFFGRVDLGSTWFFHAPVPLGTTRDNFDFQALLYRATGADFDVEMQHVGFWDLRIATADHYRSGRLFIAGDAAHSHPPYGGYGINTGFEDAANLGWKLAAVLEGWGGASLLDSYEAERRPVFVSTARDFIEHSIEADRKFLRDYDPARDRVAFEARWAERGGGAKGEVNAFEPHYEGSPIVVSETGGTPSAKGGHRLEARAGHHLAPQMLGDGRNVFEALGENFTLLCLGGESFAKGFQEAATETGIPLRIVSDGGMQARESYAFPSVLVRPDQFVAWTGHAAEDPASVLRRAAGQEAV